MIALSHAKLVQYFSNVLLLGDEYVVLVSYHFNAQIVVNMSQICHIEAFLQLFLYGCNVVLIFPCYEQIIYIYYKIYKCFPTFLTNKVALSRLKCLKFNFKRCSINFSSCSWCLFQDIQGFVELAYLMLLSLHNKTFC
jgi:hypothetical protein